MQKLVYAVAFVMALVSPPQPLGIFECAKRPETCAIAREKDRRAPVIIVVRDGKVSPARARQRPVGTCTVS